MMNYKPYLVGGFNPFEKYQLVKICQNGFIFPKYVGVKMTKNIWVATTQLYTASQMQGGD